MTVTSRDWKNTHFAYACSYNRFRGRSVCGNGLWAPMEAADREVLGDMDSKLFAPEAVEAGLRLALAELQPSDTVERGGRPSARSWPASRANGPATGGDRGRR